MSGDVQVPGAGSPGATRPTPEQLAALRDMAATVYERFGGNWQIVYDPEFDDEVSVRTEDSTSDFFIGVFTTSQVLGDDPLVVAALLMSAPALLAEVDALTADLATVSLAVARWRQGDRSATAALEEIEAAVSAPDSEDGEGDD
jgi:hypothetical protein